MIWLLLFCSRAFAAPAWEFTSDARPTAVFFDANSGSLLVSTQAGGEARVDQLSLSGHKLSTNLVHITGAAGPLRAYDGHIYWAVGGTLYRFSLEEKRLEKVVEGEKISDVALDRKGAFYLGHGESLFYLEKTLHHLRGNSLDRKPQPVCKGGCYGLERSSKGAWLSINGKNLIELGGKTLASFTSTPGRIGYVYQKDSADDLVVVPLPEEKKVAAFLGF